MAVIGSRLIAFWSYRVFLVWIYVSFACVVRGSPAGGMSAFVAEYASFRNGRIWIETRCALVSASLAASLVNFRWVPRIVGVPRRSRSTRSRGRRRLVGLASVVVA